MNKEEIISAVEKMTVLELADLVEALENKFKVSAAAPAVVAPSIEAPDQAVEKKQTEFSVFITAVGEKKIPLIKEVKTLTGLSLLECKKFVDDGSKAVVSDASKATAEIVKKTLEDAGATVEIK